MASDPIFDTLKQHLTPSMIQQMSAAIGANPEATSKAVGLALPALLGGLSRNASKPQGAADLDRALNAHDGGILDNLGGLLGGGGGAAGGGIGGAILGHILGQRRAPVEQGVGKASGLNSQQVGQLLVMLAPIIMGVLGKMKQQKGLDASQLPDVLQKSTRSIEQETPGAGGLAGILDSNNDGQIVDDLARMGSSMLGGLFKNKR
ncbi:MAG: DUF937 domain-containing protein [Thermoanaerobaculia bacterium]